jgi:hypothetical protein
VFNQNREASLPPFNPAVANATIKPTASFAVKVAPGNISLGMLKL